MTSDDRVARYYDSNTSRFLAVGGGQGTHAIHRELWGPGVASVTEAADHINRLIAKEVHARHPDGDVTILDLGCGVGGTLFRLAELLPESTLHGITISRRQYEIANRIAASKGLQDRCQFALGDFHTTRLDLEADVIVAVESFVHSEAPGRFFESVQGHLRDGGHLVLADDFLSAEAGVLRGRSLRRVGDFKAGWRVPGVCTIDVCVAAARGCALYPISDTDLTPLVRLGRIRDRVISVFSPIFRFLGLIDVPFFGNMIGGNALQIGLREGFLQYRILVFRKAS
jgi:SAM-dependent methyltransferase